MEKKNILQVVTDMAADDNHGLKMSKLLTGVTDVQQGSIVSFGVSKETGDDAKLQLHGLPNKYMICCFFIDREEYHKYLNK